jgi:hypothetical protein
VKPQGKDQMAEIIHFTPRSELDAEANLLNFIEICQSQLTAFGTQLKFDDNVWDVTEAIGHRRNTRARLVFSTWGSVNASNPTPLSEPFLSFAKAYIRYQHGIRPTKAVASRVAALRALEAALIESGSTANPASVNSQLLDRAAQICAEKFQKATAFRVGGQLEMLGRFMADHHLMVVPTRWRNPIRRPQDSVRVGKEFDQQRHDKLPSPSAISALANIFRIAKEPADVLVSSIAAILCSAPDRINEVLYLETDCEVTQKIPSTGELAYGIRWRPAKGAEPMIKWIVSSMTDVVKEALSNIRRLTAEAREIAKWYEEHPGRLYLPPHLEHLRKNERVSLRDLAEVVFLEPVKLASARAWCRRSQVNLDVAGGEYSAPFVDLQSAVLAKLPLGFPIANAELGLKYSNALCLVRDNTLHADKATLRGVIGLMNHGHIGFRLASRSGSTMKTVFERLEFTEPDGSAIRVTTHQFRHYLNTLAQAGGLSQLDIAKWSGRKDARQNDAYNHQSDRDVLALVRSVVGDEQRMFGPLARADRAALIPRDEFARLKVPTAHTTDFGYCIHDFTMLPCQIHRDCMNCDEQVCIKGDAVREANIRQRRDETRALLEQAKIATEAGYAGANRWVEHQERTLIRFNKLCEILDDPNVPLGSVIQPSGIVPASRLEQAERQRVLQGTAVSVVEFASGALLPAAVSDGANG